ncbi:MAG: immunoglobulin domain-containing protein, partial [Clostridia bacterium]|nr:immunoglobulin domain-containing protein [Clostridia bacterium]
MKKGSLFYYIYFGCVIFFVLLVTVGLIVLHSFLKTYEAAQPKSIVQNICEQYLKDGKLVELKNQYNFNLSDYETDKSAESAFAAFTGGKELNIYHSSQVPEGSELCYAIKTESNPVALIALSKSEEKFKFGISGYKVDSIKLNEKMLKSVTLTFPSNAKISVNGKKLLNKDIVNSSLPDIKDVTFGDDAVYSCSAVLDNLLDSNIKVTVEGGEDWNVIGGENSYAIEQRFSEELTKQIKDFAIEGSKVYAA